LAKKTKPLSQSILDALHSVLSALRSVEAPVLLKDLAEAVSLDERTVLIAINLLEDQGYDIKELSNRTADNQLERRFVLVRYGENDMERYYRSFGEIETPMILTSDQHIGSYGFSEIAWNQMLKDVDEFGIKTIIMPGDVYQGRGVHRMELQDCKSLSADDQVEWGINYLNQFPSSVHFHSVIGNHEEKMKGNVNIGHDMLLSTAKQMTRFHYYGHVAKLTLNKKFSMLMIHTSGPPAYAKTYKAERIFDQLLERPHLLITGHHHQLFTVGRPPNTVVAQCGTLQRENSYLLNKGVTAQVGYLILHEFSEDSSTFQFRRPKVF